MARPTGLASRYTAPLVGQLRWPRCEPVTPALQGQESVFLAVHGRSQGSEIIDINTLLNDHEFR